MNSIHSELKPKTNQISKGIQIVSRKVIEKVSGTLIEKFTLPFRATMLNDAKLLYIKVLLTNKAISGLPSLTLLIKKVFSFGVSI